MGWVKQAMVAGVLALGSAAAEAAELPPLPEAPTLPPEAALGNWYVRGDFGAAAYSTSRWSEPVTGLTMADQLLSSGFTSKSIRNPAFVDAGFGYELHPWIRADLTAEYRASVGVRGVLRETLSNSSVPLAFLGQNQFQASLQTTLVMANAYADLGTWYGLTPYFGMGIGVARHDLGGATGTGIVALGTSLNASNFPNGASMPATFDSLGGRTKTDFAWAFMAGLSYDISPNLKLDLGYRHLDLGGIQSGSIACACGQSSTGFKIRNIASNEIRVGLRWVFGEVGPSLGPSIEDVPELPQAPALPKR